MISILIALNVLKRMLREIRLLVAVFILPVLCGFLTITFLSYNEQVSVGINYKIPENSELQGMINDVKRFKLVFMEEGEIRSKIENRELGVGIVFPENYGLSVAEGKRPEVKVLGYKNNADVIHMRAILEIYLDTLYMGAESITKQHLINIKNNIGVTRISIGFLLTCMFLFAASAMELFLKDKTEKTNMRIFISPVKNYQALVGYFLAILLIGVMQISLFLTFSNIMLGFEWKTSIFSVFIILFIFFLSCVGFCIGLIGFIKDQQTYSLLTFVLAVFTSLMGGCYYATNLMGEKLEGFSNLMPQKWAMGAYEKLCNSGDFSSIVINLIIMLLFGVFLASLGLHELKPNPDNF